jgi:hypothetical protein
MQQQQPAWRVPSPFALAAFRAAPDPAAQQGQ